MGERELDPAAYDRETACDWVSGSFMLARSEAVRAVGLMDERYFLYCEEPDLCKSLKAAGWEVRYLPDMTILHYWGKEGPNARLSAQLAYARRQYLFKHHRTLSRWLTTLALALHYARGATIPLGGGAAVRARRVASRSALWTLLGLAPAPFGELSGHVRGGPGGPP